MVNNTTQVKTDVDTKNYIQIPFFEYSPAKISQVTNVTSWRHVWRAYGAFPFLNKTYMTGRQWSVNKPSTGNVSTLTDWALTHCLQEAPYGDIHLGHHWLRWRLVAWWHQAIIWIDDTFLSVKSSGIHLRAIPLETLMMSINMLQHYIFKITAINSRKQWVKMQYMHIPRNIMADSRFPLSQWEAALLCNDVSHWLGANLDSALNMHTVLVLLLYILHNGQFYSHYLGLFQWQRGNHKITPVPVKRP